MEENFKNKRNIISMVLILVAILVIIIMAVIILNNKANNEKSKVVEDNKNTINYVATLDGNKSNTSEELSADKKVGKILIEKSKISYEKGTSKLTSKVTNDNVAKDNLKFIVKFITNDGSVIAQSVGYVGKIKANETKYIDSYITSDVSNAKDITYEISQ
ncbi:MAG: hypothetical protein PHD15_04495 [Clostridia bacterium]|nr:hypothetical protein [Clostridia bacterium]MDD4386999.1 hypothetical protein [Clostridia bacterium]